MFRSTITQRQMQGRFVHFDPMNPTTVMHGVVLQDEGDTPKVQIQFPDLNDTAANEFKLGKLTCQIMVLVDGTPRTLSEGSGQDDKVALTTYNNVVVVEYIESGFKVDVRVGHWRHGFYLSAYAHVPDVDRLVGIMGTPDGKSRT